MRNTKANGMTFTRKASAMKAQRALEAAQTGVTVSELAEILCVNRRTAYSYLSQLRAEGRIYIARWVRDVDAGGFYPRPVYVAGSRPDAPKPPPLTYSERNKRAWKRIASDPERALDNLARQRRKRFKPRPDPAAAWLFGRVTA